MSAPPTRILSWQQLVLEADPLWQRENIQPWIYEFSNRRRFWQTIPTYTWEFTMGLGNDGGVLYLLPPFDSSYPTTDAGLRPGAVWSQAFLGTDYTTIIVVPGGQPDNSIPDMYFGVVTALELLNYGGSNLPTSPPPGGSEQLWNNGGLVCVA